MIPQLIVIIMFICVLIKTTNRNGKKTKQRYNIWKLLLSVLIWVWVLYAGGFWDGLINK